MLIGNNRYNRYSWISQKKRMRNLIMLVTDN